MMSTLTPEQLSARSSVLTATDMVKLSGLAPAYYGGPINVYADKTGIGAIATEMNEDIARGIFLERAARKWYAYKTSRAVEEVGVIKHKDFTLFAATPDGISYDPAGLKTRPEEFTQLPDARVLEIKCPRYGYDWEEGAPPPHYKIQVTMQMLLTGIHCAEIAAIINGALMICEVDWVPEMAESIIEIGEKFWRDHVLKRVPPDPDGSNFYAQWLAERHPQELHTDLLPMSEESIQWAERYRSASDAEKEAAASKMEARNNLVALIGDHAGIEGGDGRPLVTYRKCKDSQNIDYRGVVDGLNPDAAVVARHIKVKTGHRSIKVYT